MEHYYGQATRLQNAVVMAQGQLDHGDNGPH
jgi:hypothetical protein